MTPFRLTVLACALLFCSCASRKVNLDEFLKNAAMDEEDYAKLLDPEHMAQPTLDTTDGFDWIRLNSGEWLKGKLTSLEKEVVEFESDELGDLSLDWDDIAEIRASRNFTILLDGPVEIWGKIHLYDDNMYVASPSGNYEFHRKSVYRMVDGRPDRANYWSGGFSLGGTVRSGNNDQVDYTASFNLLRQTGRSRLPITFYSSYGEVDNQRNTDNQRFNSQYDYYLDSEIFVTPLGIELYRDSIQNLDLRAAPFTGVGYRIADKKRFEWNVLGGLGWRYTRYDSVMVGAANDDSTAALVLGSKLTWEPNSKVDVDLNYDAQIGLEDSMDSNQTITLVIDVELWSDFDLNVRTIWNRIGDPQPEEDGSIPENDDLQVTVGIEWEF